MPRYRLFLASLIFVVPVVAQPPGGPAVSLGHIHLNAADAVATTAFWKDVIGIGTVTSHGMAGVGTSGITVLIAPHPPSGPSTGAAIDHLSFRVAGLQPFIDVLEKKKYKGFKVLPDKEHLLIDGPDGVQIELVENSDMYTTIEFNGVGLLSPQPQEMKAWYVKSFSGGGRGGPPADGDKLQIPGATLVFSQGSVVPSAGRAIDHVGFEVRDMAATVKRLTDNGAKVESATHADAGMKANVAVLTDPWGTRLELIEIAAN